MLRRAIPIISSWGQLRRSVVANICSRIHSWERISLEWWAQNVLEIESWRGSILVGGRILPVRIIRRLLRTLIWICLRNLLNWLSGSWIIFPGWNRSTGLRVRSRVLLNRRDELLNKKILLIVTQLRVLRKKLLGYSGYLVHVVRIVLIWRHLFVNVVWYSIIKSIWRYWRLCTICHVILRNLCRVRSNCL